MPLFLLKHAIHVKNMQFETITMAPLPTQGFASHCHVIDLENPRPTGLLSPEFVYAANQGLGRAFFVHPMQLSDHFEPLTPLEEGEEFTVCKDTVGYLHHAEKAPTKIPLKHGERLRFSAGCVGQQICRVSEPSITFSLPDSRGGLNEWDPLYVSPVFFKRNLPLAVQRKKA